jgi:hypothetical protein
MTKTIYGWMVVREDGEPLRNIETGALAVFEEKPKTAKRLVPCTIVYGV